MSTPHRTPRPWVLPRIQDADIFAVKALADGTADEHQQRRVYAFIREQLCSCEIMSFWPGPDGDRATAFAEGKRWVATQMRRIVRLKPGNIDPRGEPPAMPAATTETPQGA